MKKTLASFRSRQMITAVLVGAALTTLTSPAPGASLGQRTSKQPSPEAVQNLSRYCQACWRNARLHPDCWSDCTQEVFLRLLQTVAPERWSTLLTSESEDRDEFLRAIDAVKKRSQRARKFAVLPQDVFDPRKATESARNELREELERLSGMVLSQRQQRIVHLTQAGWSVPEIAQELATTVERVSDEKYKAIQKLRKEIHG